MSNIEQSIIDSVNIHIAVLDASGTIIVTNRSWNTFACMNGVPQKNAFLGVNYLEVCAHSAREGNESARQALEGMQAVLAGRLEKFSLEYPCHSPEEQRWFVMQATKKADGSEGLVVTHENVTDRRIAEDLLRQEKNLSLRYLEVAAVMMVALNAQGEVTLINRKGCEILGYQSSEIIGMNWFERVIPPEFKAEVKEVFSNLIAGNVEPVTYYENLVVTRDGLKKLIAWNNNYIRDDDGHIVGVISSGTDITERSATEAALRIHYKAIATSLSPIAMADFDGTLTYVNQAFLESWGYRSSAEVLGKSAMQFWREPEMAAAVMQEVLKDNRSRGELTAIRADGIFFEVELHASLVRDDAGNPVSLLGSFLDITERKRNEEALRQSEARFRAIFDGSNDVIFLHDAETGAILLTNAKISELYGYTPEEALSLSVGDLSADIAPYTQVDALAWLNRAAQGERLLFEWLAKHKDGNLFWVEVSMRRAEISESPCILVTVRDITLRKQMEEALHQEAMVWTEAMDQFDDVIYLLSPDRRLIRANQAFYELTHSTPEQLVGRLIEEIIHSQSEATLCPVCLALEEKRDALITMEADDPGNPTGWPIEIHVKILRDAFGAVKGILMSLHDLTASRHVDDKLSLAAAVFSSTHDGVMIADVNANLVAVNDSFSKITGYAQSEVLGKNPRLLQSGRHNKAFYQFVWDSILENGFWQGEIWNKSKLGEIYPAWLTISAVSDSAGHVKNYVGVFSDISLLKKTEEKLAHQAHHDALTNLPNRLLLHSRLEHAIDHAKRNGGRVAILFFDLDRFKNINDSLGHPVGDELLKSVAERIQQRLRGEDTLARLGGDEFVVLVERVLESQEAAVVARDILEALSQPFILTSVPEVYIGGSIGISLFPDDGNDATQLIRNADAAMYQAKNHGRNTYFFYTSALTSAANLRLSQETKLRRALERGEFVLHYQPQVNASTGDIVAVEALVRWQQPEDGLVLPADFIPIAEETGLILTLGEWVLETACAQIKQWQLNGFPQLGLAVNISPRQFSSPDLSGYIASVLDHHQFDPAQLELEITESALMSPQCKSEATLKALKKTGVRIAIDDFGTGYSSLAYLRRFPIDTLKIDQSFVKEIPAVEEDMAIAATIIAMSRNLHLSVQAEGVETEAQLAFLCEHLCENYQGNYFSPPLTVEQFEAIFMTSAVLPK